MENVCRTCLRTPHTLFPLYQEVGLINKIETISSIQLIDNDKLPSTICEECISNVNKLYNFRKVIINSDKELNERLATLERTKSKSELHENISIKEEVIPQTDALFEDEHSPLGPMTSSSDTETAPQSPHISTSIKRALATMKLCKCNTCNLTFTSRFKLYNHRRTEHVSPGICNICGMVVRADNLRRHVALHSESPTECQHCGKLFKNSESLRGHMLIHRGVVFTCEVCGKQSKVKAEHRRHMKTHLDPEIGKVMCTICGKKVRDLKKHMHSHTGERPYLCNYCNKGFTSPYSLKVHTRQHTNEKPFVCEFCPMAFPQKVSLVTHLKSKHNFGKS